MTDDKEKKKVKYDSLFAKELLFHADTIFHQRVNFFLVIEAIFLAAFATLWDKQEKMLSLSICMIALIFTFCIFYTLIRLDNGLAWLVVKYIKIDTSGFYEEYTNIGNYKNKHYICIKKLLSPISDFGFGAAFIFVYVLPIVAVAFWLLMFLFGLGM